MGDTNLPNIPKWQIEQTHPEVIDELEEALSQVVDPELGLNIIQLGLVRNVEIKENQVVITMILTTPFCPYGPSIMESTRKKAEDILHIDTIINYGHEAWDPTMMDDGLADDWGLY